jgi:hypothetical protein
MLLIVLLLAIPGCGLSPADLLAEPSVTAPPAATSTAPLPPTLAPRRPTATLAPTPTLAAPATAAPTLAAVSTEAPAAPPTAAPPTPKPTFQPLANGRFSGGFAGGQIVFRLNDAGTYITLKEITLSGIQCGAKKINKHMTFESISFFKIENGEFSFEVEQATVSGAFDSATSAHGSLSLDFSVAKTNCDIGPLSWTATGARE